MDPEIKAKWIAALRSGKYSQTKCTLRDPAGFCCLGVLCDLMQPTGWHKNIHQNEWSHLGNYSNLEPEIREDADLSIVATEWLTHMNDAGKTFAEIADYIEEKL